MINLVDYAKNELRKIGINDMVAKAILDLIELFSLQGHSEFSALYVINTFNRLARYKPLSPLTGDEDEWNKVGDHFQNKRYPAVFKDKNGRVYNIEGKLFTDDGETFYITKDSEINVTFPYTVPDKPEFIYRNKTGMTMEEIDKAVEKIREHCCNNNCGTCGARSIYGCVFSGYPNEWITV